ncbi:hypothetical protein HG530_003560 [Fusarium avenaceum]|nr:hypothetical protein HG530_003560 [Fusarium avenaceum]
MQPSAPRPIPPRGCFALVQYESLTSGSLDDIPASKLGKKLVGEERNRWVVRGSQSAVTWGEQLLYAKDRAVRTIKFKNGLRNKGHDERKDGHCDTKTTGRDTARLHSCDIANRTRRTLLVAWSFVDLPLQRNAVNSNGLLERCASKFDELLAKVVLWRLKVCHSLESISTVAPVLWSKPKGEAGGDRLATANAVAEIFLGILALMDKRASVWFPLGNLYACITTPLRLGRSLAMILGHDVYQLRFAGFLGANVDEIQLVLEAICDLEFALSCLHNIQVLSLFFQFQNASNLGLSACDVEDC